MDDIFMNRMRSLGESSGESWRNHSQKFMDASWKRDPAYRAVYVKWVDNGVPTIYDDDQLIDAKFNAKSYHNITGDEVAYLLQFRLEDIKNNPNVKVGSYVSIENELGEREWWLIWHYDDRPQFRQFSILKCTWTYKWVTYDHGERVYHECLGVTRNQKNYNSGVWLDYVFQVVEQQHVMFLPANEATNTIQYDSRFLISNVGRYPPIAWRVSKIQPSVSFDIATFTMTQEQFDPNRDSYELMIANYLKSNVTPDCGCPELNNLRIVNSGSATVTAGGGWKKFTVKEEMNDELKDITTDVIWKIDFGENNDKITLSIDKNTCRVKCKNDYSLIGKVFKLIAEVNGKSTSAEVEVIGL